ncbi:uncharacterized protein J8A68_001278 [[Candida] subhashii]|uniref:Uncharacterized protein n=1 Tax=[Candida] subhashii TaxID=561895 RepID=A0A8J5USC1_9ASCO|nr:uncharacterized protein J8A68_001278 [[Candida] subhashii]KAG7665222.1 hypothetical protein J8A68_001278 [[Candida] subhashii]
MNNKSYYSIIAFIISYQLLIWLSLYHYIPQQPSAGNQFIVDLLIGILISIVTYIIYFIHAIIKESNHFIPKLDLFDLFLYPIFKELIKLLIIVYKYQNDITLYNIYFISLGYYLSNSQIYYYSPNNYKSTYHQFLKLYDIWLYQDQYKYNYHNNQQEIQYLINNILDDDDYSTVSTNRNSICTHDSQKTLYSTNSLTPPKKLTGKKLPIEFNLHNNNNNNQDVHLLPHESPKFQATPMDISKSIETVSTINTLKDYQSCSNFVDKLYSVSPRNTYHLNTATAIATFEDFGREDQHSSDTVIYTKINKPEQEETYENINHHLDEDTSSINTKGTHFGGGGGGNFKLKLPGGTKIEFGGGAGGDYSHEDPHSSSTTPISPSTSSTPHNNRIIKFINWFKWLLPPLLPIGEDSTTTTNNLAQFQGERYPLLKHRLSTYNLHHNSEFTTSPSNLETGGLAEFKPHLDRFIKFRYFILYNYNFVIGQLTSRIKVDPVFKRFGQLIEDMNAWILGLNEMNEFIWELIVFGVFGYLRNYYYLVAMILIGRLYKDNYLFFGENRFDYRFAVLSESMIGVWFGVGCVYLYLA